MTPPLMCSCPSCPFRTHCARNVASGTVPGDTQRWFVPQRDEVRLVGAGCAYYVAVER